MNREKQRENKKNVNKQHTLAAFINTLLFTQNACFFSNLDLYTTLFHSHTHTAHRPMFVVFWVVVSGAVDLNQNHIDTQTL